MCCRWVAFYEMVWRKPDGSVNIPPALLWERCDLVLTTYRCLVDAYNLQPEEIVNMDEVRVLASTDSLDDQVLAMAGALNMWLHPCSSRWLSYSLCGTVACIKRTRIMQRSWKPTKRQEATLFCW